jgi:hypothetical protein
MIGILTQTPEAQEPKIEVIHSDNWELPVLNLGMGKYAWRPKTAFLPYHLFDGPAMSRRTHGINLNKDLSIGIHGPRGSTKTLTNSFLLAKKMRSGQPVWANWPISFYVMEASCYDKCDKRTWFCPFCKHGDLSYYENHPLDYDKLYTFNSELSEGAVGITEMQYYAESRTSGRGQNRMLSYQIMQIRKSALSFFYDVQDPEWADKRFSWSDDVKIFCSDLSKQNYDEASIGHEIAEGEFSHWRIRDISGVCTGVQYKNTFIEYGPYQFDGFHFWWIYPTRFKVDVAEAINSMKVETKKNDKDAEIGKAMSAAVNWFLDAGVIKVLSKDMWAKASELGGITVSPFQGGRVLTAYKVPKIQTTGGVYKYDISQFLNNDGGAEVPK